MNGQTTNPSIHGQPAPQLMTMTEASDALRISKYSLYRLIHQRRLTTIKIGSRRLVPSDSVRELVGALVAEERKA